MRKLSLVATTLLTGLLMVPAPAQARPAEDLGATAAGPAAVDLTPYRLLDPRPCVVPVAGSLPACPEHRRLPGSPPRLLPCVLPAGDTLPACPEPARPPGLNVVPAR